MKIFNLTQNNIIAEDAGVADTFLSRMVGLLDRKHLSKEEALVITRCNSIHMFFMKFPIDAVFLNKTNKVVGLTEDIKPFQLSKIFFQASYVIELSSGTISEKNISLGDDVLLK